MTSINMKQLIALAAIALTADAAPTSAQPERDREVWTSIALVEENIIKPVERRKLSESTVTLNTRSYMVEVQHVLYDNLASVYHHTGVPISDPIPRRKKYAIEVSLRPVDDKNADPWIVLRLTAGQFEPNADVGFLVAPPTIGVGVWRRRDGDRLLVAKWSVSMQWSTCEIHAVEPDHIMLPVVRVMYNIRIKGQTEREWVPDPEQTYVYHGSFSHLSTIPLHRASWVDPDAALRLSGSGNIIEIVQGAWRGADYMVKAYTHFIETGEVVEREPAPAERAIFEDMELTGPPTRLMEQERKPMTIEEWIERQEHGPKRE